MVKKSVRPTAKTVEQRHIELMSAVDKVARAVAEDKRESRQDDAGDIRQDTVIATILKRLEEHEAKEFEIWGKTQGLYSQVGQSIITLNHEMGSVQAELAWIKWLMGATTLAVIGQTIKTIFFP